MIVTAAVVPLLYKVGGYGLATSLMCKVLERMGKPDLAKAIHTLAWAALGAYAIDFTLDHARMVWRMWG